MADEFKYHDIVGDLKTYGAFTSRISANCGQTDDLTPLDEQQTSMATQICPSNIDFSLPETGRLVNNDDGYALLNSNNVLCGKKIHVRKIVTPGLMFILSYKGDETITYSRPPAPPPTGLQFLCLLSVVVPNTQAATARLVYNFRTKDR